MKPLLCAAAMFSLFACNQTKSESKAEATNPSANSVQTAINSALDYHTTASNNYDVKACGEMFTDDATVIEYSGTVKKMNGRREIDSVTTLECEAFKKANMKFDVKWTTNSLRITGDTAYHDATVTFTINSPGNAPTHARAESMIAWKKTATDQWKAHTVVLYSH